MQLVTRAALTRVPVRVRADAKKKNSSTAESPLAKKWSIGLFASPFSSCQILSLCIDQFPHRQQKRLIKNFLVCHVLYMRILVEKNDAITVNKY